ncbi:MAG: NAD(+) diphosphatase [Desulfobacterales bacterium]|nr:NAD(+) diphosphatase [Desulfobacterales bacterium]
MNRKSTHMPFVPAILPEPEEKGPAWWFLFSGQRLLVRFTGEEASIPCVDDLESLHLKILRKNTLGILDGRPCYSAECEADIAVPDGMDFQGLRRLAGHLKDQIFWLAALARQILDWDRSHQYCGQCGGPTVDKKDERAKVCPACGLTNFSRMSPAIIVAVLNGDRILLARAARFANNMYSVLAGFVEPGESLEECVRREVREEVGVEVKNIRYFGSQPWLFPNSLMVAFTADYAGGEISVDKAEIVDAAWFQAGGLPLIPDKISIARRLIDWFVERGTSRGFESR